MKNNQYRLSKQAATIAILLLLGFFTISLFNYCSPKSPSGDAIASQPNEYVGNQACQSCHQQEYNLWKQSDHFKAMQAPNDSSVEGNFNNIFFKADGVTTSFSHNNEKYSINTEGIDGKQHAYEVKYTFGYYPLQQYLIQTDSGKLQATRVSWDARQKNGLIRMRVRRFLRAIGYIGQVMHKTGTRCVPSAIVPICKRNMMLTRIRIIPRLMR